MTPRLVILDFDGTLADTFPWFVGALEEAAERFGFRYPDAAEREALRGCAPREIIARLGVPLWKVPLVARHMRARKAQAAPLLPLFPGTPTLLHGLSARGIALAIATSDSEASVRRTLGAELSALVRWLECGAPLFGKAARLRRLLRRAGVAPGEALFIGDERRDAEAAREAGLRFGAAAWGFATAEALAAERPDFLFRGPEEVSARLAGATG